MKRIIFNNSFSHLLLVLIPFALLACYSHQSLAKAYKYQDKQGRWHFTDRPPQKQFKAEEINISRQKRSGTTRTGNNSDLANLLNNKFPTDKPEKKATLAVVEIKNAIGLGSGFFFSENGYIVTNKHVVKPTESTQWNKYKQKLAQQKAHFLVIRNNLDRRGAYHDKLYNSLLDYERTIKKVRNRESRRVLEARYNITRNNYQESERLLKILKSRYSTAKKDLEASQSFLRRKDRESYWAQKYKIRLKDGAELYAKYIGASKKHDLAFLKLDGHNTPFLTAAKQNQNIQGSKVYAIGSPLGISDSLTAGTITRIENNYLYTDTKVFPGNSGGPLINEEGKVLGVITQKITQGKAQASGFGRALPISLVTDELAKFR